MTYPELKIALDMGDSETVLSSLTDQYNSEDLRYCGCYLVVCDDGDIHSFDKNGREHEIDYIPHDCFSYDHYFEKIIIPDSVTSIGAYAFSSCTNLMSVTIGNSVTSIRYAAFSGCSSLKSVTISDSVTSIGEMAFEDCSGLKSMIIPNNVMSIGWATFWSCYSLKSIVFKGKTIDQVKAMANYPWEIEDESIIQARL